MKNVLLESLTNTMETPDSEQRFVGFEDFILRQSIWTNIEKLIDSIDERNEIKKIIGQSIVDETLDLHTELLTLYGIWKEYHEETTNLVCKPSIPEPPLLRENLEKQISMMVQLLQSKLSKQGNRSISAFLTDGEKAMIKSVSTGSKSQESSRRQSTTSAQKEKLYSDRDTPSSGYELRCSSALSVDINCLQENVNVVNIYTIAQPLREDFEDERRLLLDDITYIQNAMIAENERWEREKQERISSPTIKDLRKLSVKLEKEILHKDKEKNCQGAKSNASIKSRRLAPLSSSSSLSKKSSSRAPQSKTAKFIATATVEFPASSSIHSTTNNTTGTADRNSCRTTNTAQIPYYDGSGPHPPSPPHKLTPSPPCSERSVRTSAAGNLRKTINMRKLAEGTVG